MGEFKKIREAYEKLWKDNPELPEAEEFFRVFGLSEEDDLKSLLKLFKKLQKVPSNVAHWVLEILSPPDPIAAHDNKAVKNMKKELMDCLKTCVLVDKRFTLASFEAARSENPEKILSKAIYDAAKELKPVGELLEKITKITLNSWETDSQEEEVSYRW